MPFTVFDAVGKFHADTSDLDQFIVKLEQGLTSASEKAAASTRALKSAQDEFRASIKAVSVEGGDTAENLLRLSEAEKNLALSAAAAKLEHAALKEELLGTKESAGIATQATEELSGKLASMFGVIAAAEGFKSLIEGAQKSVLQLQLLSEKTGIAISTLAGVQHVAESNGVAFEDVSTALTRLSRSQALAIEGGKAQITAFERIGISVNELKKLSPEELFYRVAGAMANSKNHAEENASAFALLGRGGAALIPIFQQNTEALHAMVDEAARASGVTKEAGQAALDWEKQVANLTESVRAGLIPVMQFLVPVIKVVEELGADTALALRAIGAAIGGVALAQIDSIKALLTISNDAIHFNYKTIVGDTKAAASQVRDDLGGIAEDVKLEYKKTTDFIKDIWKDADPIKGPKDDLSDLANRSGNASKEIRAEIEAAKTAFRTRMDEIDQEKDATRAAYLLGSASAQQWADAQVKATSDALDAQEKFRVALTDIAKKGSEAAKLVASAQEEATRQTLTFAKTIMDGLDKAQTRTAALREEMEKLVFPIAKTQEQAKAFKDLETAEERLAKAEKDLALVDPTRDFERQKQAVKDLADSGIISKQMEAARLKQLDQEESQNAIVPLKEQQAAIQRLAQLRVISKQQEAAMLAKAEDDEAKRQLTILDELLVQQKAKLDAAKVKFIAASKDALFPAADLAILKTRLNEAQIAWDKTETEILKLKTQDNSKLLALDQNYYGRSLALLLATGKQKEAEQLKETHASLLSAQAQLADAKARGVNTQAMKDQIKQLETLVKEWKKEESALEHAAKQGLSAWKEFGSGFRQEAEQDKKSIEQLGAEMEQDVQSFVASIGTAFEAMVTHQESFGAAMEASTFRLLSSMAQHWAEYFAAKAIADIFMNPALGAAEFAAAGALYAISGVLSGEASNVESKGSGSSSASTGTPAPAAGSPNVTAGSQPTQTKNTPHLATGAIVFQPTPAVVGDDETGQGGAPEAILPLSNRNAMEMIAAALLPGILKALPAATPGFPIARTGDAVPVTQSTNSGRAEAPNRIEVQVNNSTPPSADGKTIGDMIASSLLPAIANVLPSGRDLAFKPFFPQDALRPTQTLLAPSTISAASANIGSPQNLRAESPRPSSPLSTEHVDKLTEAIISSSKAGSRGDINVKVEGLISSDNLDKVISQITHRVSTGRAHLLASDSKRFTKRSP